MIDRARATQLVASICDLVGHKCHAVGSYRRGYKQVGDLDFVVADASLLNLTYRLEQEFKKLSILRLGTHLLSFKTNKGLQIEFTNVPAKSFGAALIHGTGSSNFNVGMRTYCRQKGLLLNQYGLYKKDDIVQLAGKTEVSVFNKLGLDWIPPANRDNFWKVKDSYKRK